MFSRTVDARSWGDDPTDFDPEVVQAFAERISFLFEEGGLFPTTVEGWDRLPAPGCLLVANHCGGAIGLDVYGLGQAWVRRFGAERPAHILAHDLLFNNPRSGAFFARRGGLRASRENAQRILAEYKRDLLVYPGGDMDCWGLWRERYAVNFSGRLGYARVAALAQVPIVPIAHAGAHDSLIVLTQGRRLAKWSGFERLFRTGVFPVHLSMPYGIGVGPMPHLPAPSRLRYRIGQPVAPPVLRPGEEPSEAALRELDARVQASLQAELDVLQAQATRRLDRLERALERLSRRPALLSRLAERAQQGA